MQAFAPVQNGTKSISVSGSSQAVSLGVGVAQVRVMNNGTATAWIAFGPTGVTTTTTAGMPVGPGVTEVLTLKLDGDVSAAAIAAGATGSIYFTPGVGI